MEEFAGVLLSFTPKKAKMEKCLRLMRKQCNWTWIEIGVCTTKDKEAGDKEYVNNR